jgi:hypothetical protein
VLRLVHGFAADETSREKGNPLLMQNRYDGFAKEHDWVFTRFAS